MSEQPLFDVESLKKIDAQPGDAFVLELPIEYAEPDKEELERIGAKLKSVLGEQVKVIIPPPGTKLRRVPGPYYYRRQVQGVEEEIGFATHEEMMAYLKKDEPQVATAEEIEKLQAKFLKVYAENPLQAMFLPPVAEYKPSLTWGDVEKLTQDALKWGKEYTEKAAVSALKQADLRILLDGEPVPIGSPAYCTLWVAEEIDCTTHIVGTQRRRGQFIVRSGCDLLGRRVRVEHLGDGEAFDALVTLMTGPGRYFFVSDGPPSPLPASSLKEANEQHAAEGLIPPSIIAVKPPMRYLRSIGPNRLQGSKDMKTWVDLDPTTMDPVEPQADEPHKITWKEWL